MGRKVPWIIAGTLLTVGVTLTAVSLTGDLTVFEVEITEEAAQKGADTFIEKPKPLDEYLTIETADVDFAEDHIVVDGTGFGKFRGRHIHVKVHAKGQLEYRGDGKFFLHLTEDPDISGIKVVRAPAADEKPRAFPRFREKLKEKMPALKERAQEFLEKHDLDDITEAFRADLKDWAARKAGRLARGALTRYPIYQLKDDPSKDLATRMKIQGAKLSLKKMEVRGDRLVATLSPSKATTTVLVTGITILLAGLVVIGLLLFAPEVFVALGLLGAIAGP